MSDDKRKICPLCAWRANCTKRFTRGDEAGLHCPDFSEDVTLKIRRVDAVEEPGRNDND